MLSVDWNKFPQLRVRTGYTFREVFAHLPATFDRLKEVGAPCAGMVDSGTWGHVRWQKEAAKAGVQPFFGMEFPVFILDEEGERSGKTPKAWVLGVDLKAMYTFTSLAVQNKGVTPDQLRDLKGCVRFSGGALDILGDDDFDYIDINPSSYLLAAQGVKRHRETGKPMVLTGYNDLLKVEDRDAAYSWEVRDSVGMRTIEHPEDMSYMLSLVMTTEEIESAVANTFKVAELLKDSTVLNKAPIIKVEGDMEAIAREGIQDRLKKGHIAEWTPEYEDRLQMEISQIMMKGFDSYFIVVADLVRYAKTQMLVGPARGSAAGSLVCYVMGITEIDPIPHKLLFQRFIDVSRADFPDIDIDFNDNKRHLVFEYLAEKYGQKHVSRVGSINTLKGRSVLAQVSKKFSIPVLENFSIQNAMIEYPAGDPRYGHGMEDTFAKTEPGKNYAARHGAAVACMSKIEIHPSHSGVHAAGIIVCNDPVEHYATVNAEGIAQIDKVDAEEINLLKIDVLGLRTLGIIEDANVISSDELYSLRFDDPEVLAIIGDDKVSAVFQFEGDAVRSCTRQIRLPMTFGLIDNLTSLARPGPLSSGMAAHFIDRANGLEKVTFAFPELEKHLKDTFGVILYQEQLMSIIREIGGFDWAMTSAVRKGMAKSKGEEYLNQWLPDFVKGAVANGISEENANKLWSELAKFGAYGFNKSHSVAYAAVTYWTAYLKRYHRLEYAAASLRAAKDDEQTIAILREMDREGTKYTAMDPERSAHNWQVVDGRLVGGIMNAHGYGPSKAEKYISLREARFNDEKSMKAYAKALETLKGKEVKFADLNEAHTKFGHYYQSPRLAGILSGERIKNMANADSRDDTLFIAKLVEKKLIDDNSEAMKKRRGGKEVKGQSLKLDLYMIDDSLDSTMRVRIKPEKYLEFGKEIFDNAKKGDWFLVRGWKIKNFEMFIVKKIKKLMPEEAQNYGEE